MNGFLPTTEHDKPEMDEEAFDKMMVKKMIKVHKSNQRRTTFRYMMDWERLSCSVSGT